jgi:hypothetical protein
MDEELTQHLNGLINFQAMDPECFTLNNDRDIWLATLTSPVLEEILTTSRLFLKQIR